MNNQLIHPQLMDDLYRFFPHTCDIERGTYADDGVGETSDSNKSWATLLDDINCKVSAWNATRDGDEVKRADKTIVMHPYVIMLKGWYNTITEGDRVLEGGIYYDILAVDFDSEDTMTRLICERVTP